ncbi:sensor histidine kinase KdpD [Nostoc sp. PCC 7107]|uniref:sensor histidine kinase n=1 Tax=Nostoc sp. PCC 7107 TaxID=317936 RepID=UPI00029F1654|nr:sensor histidine kinase [Nostoc sp. PCC 7107]AFY41206.1 histidine kinase [Nostoc sp. PCC 7107]
MAGFNLFKHISKQKIVITATFTSEPVEDFLSYWLQEIGIPYLLEFTPYNQVFQELLNPISLMANNQDGVNVLLVRFEDWEGNKNRLQLQVDENLKAEIFGDRLRKTLPNHIEIAHLNQYETEYLYQEIFLEGFQFVVDEEFLLHGSGLFNIYATRYNQNQTLEPQQLNKNASQLEQIVKDFGNALKTAAVRSPIPHIVCICPASVTNDAEANSSYQRIEGLLADKVKYISPVDLCALCSSALADVEAIAAQKRITLISELPEPGGMIEIDALMFRRVLDNLFTNAIKFSPSNSQVTLRAEYLPAGGAKLQVADSGKGVSEELRQIIFEKYEVGTRMPEVSQIGLGLAFCKMAVEAHCGTINIANNHTQGSIFTVII